MLTSEQLKNIAKYAQKYNDKKNNQIKTPPKLQVIRPPKPEIK